MKIRVKGEEFVRVRVAYVTEVDGQHEADLIALSFERALEAAPEVERHSIAAEWTVDEEVEA